MSTTSGFHQISDCISFMQLLAVSFEHHGVIAIIFFLLSSLKLLVQPHEMLLPNIAKK